MATGGLYQKLIITHKISAAHPGMPRKCRATWMEEGPKVTLDIQCLQQGGGAASTSTYNYFLHRRGSGGARAIMV